MPGRTYVPAPVRVPLPFGGAPRDVSANADASGCAPYRPAPAPRPFSNVFRGPHQVRQSRPSPHGARPAISPVAGRRVSKLDPLRNLRIADRWSTKANAIPEDHAFMNNCAVVITTINHPTKAVIDIATHGSKLGLDVVLVGDDKSPANFNQDGARYLSLDAQRETGFQYAGIAPARHYARKNVGYLAAIASGAEMIIETDDDNIPMPTFWNERQAAVRATVISDPRWINIYAYFSKSRIWPRGLPLREIQRENIALEEAVTDEIYCPIQQGLADGDPDVDAIYRLVAELPVEFQKRDPIALTGEAWCPFNSQNTTWWAAAFPLLYLPYYCSFRMTDIWRSFVAQRIAYANGWGILFHSATVFQERNEHNLMRDFEEEIPGYLRNDEIRQALTNLSLEEGSSKIPENLRICYGKLADMGCVGAEELPLLNAWLSDLADIVTKATHIAG